MHLVAALDRVPGVRGVLTLFEGVASGAADGYARMAGGPAATLLHLGPGFGNAFANVHNAYKGRTPMVNLVGDHAVAHKPLGAPLASRCRVGRAARVALGADGARRALGGAGHGRGGRGGAFRRRRDADRSGRRGLGRSRSGPVAAAAGPARRRRCRRRRSRRARGRCVRAAPRCCSAARRRARAGWTCAARIAAATGATLLRDTFAARLARGGARPAPAGRAVPDRDGGRRLEGVLVAGPGRTRGGRSGSSPTRGSRACWPTRRRPCSRWRRRARMRSARSEELAAAVGAPRVGLRPGAGAGGVADRRRAERGQPERGRRRAAARRRRGRRRGRHRFGRCSSSARPARASTTTCS